MFDLMFGMLNLSKFYQSHLLSLSPMKFILVIALSAFLAACQTPAVPPTPTDNQRLGITDSDNDGVPDRLDNCPNTPFGISVGQSGCPMMDDRTF